MSPTPATPAMTRFLALAAVWNLVLFGLLRLSWVEANLILPLTALETRVALWLSGTPGAVRGDLSCSGTDAIALLLAVVLAYPVPIRQQLTGAALGALLLVVLNVARLGSLGRVARDPGLFEFLHVYFWPAVLVLAAAGFFWWWSAGRRRAAASGPAPPREVRPLPVARFALFAVPLGLLYLGLAPWYLKSPTVFVVAHAMARTAMAILQFGGAVVSLSGNTLLTASAGFQVTQECIVTPLIPLYLAGVLAMPARAGARALLLLIAAPLFFALGTTRLLLLALPLAASAFLTHAFFQLVLGVLVVAAVAWLSARRVGAPVWRRVAAGMATGILTAALASGVYQGVVLRAGGFLRHVLFSGAASTSLGGDGQGALVLLPVFQLALFLALLAATGTVRSPRLVLGVVLLFATQALLLAVVSELGEGHGLRSGAVELRGLALLLPIGLWFVLGRGLPLGPRAEQTPA
jgi:exosortase/archaeosortase family protein